MAKRRSVNIRYPVIDWVERGYTIEVPDDMTDGEVESYIRDRHLDLYNSDVITDVEEHGVQDRGYEDEFLDDPDFSDWIEVIVEDEYVSA